MVDSQDRANLMNDRSFEWFQLLGPLGMTAAGYPFEYVKVLIQIGHEPFPPRPTRTLLGRPALGLPGVFTYMKHIKKVDGFWGLYRGLWPKLCTNFLTISTYKVVYEKVPDFITRDLLFKAEAELTDSQKLKLHFNELVKVSIAKGVTIIASHPLHVVTIRTIAQFVGREEKYSGIFGSLGEIYRQDGILGFFYGLIPRLIGEMLSLLIGTSIAIFINTYFVEEETLKGYVKASMSYLSNALFYPGQVISHVSIVNNCGLKAGLPSNMPIYSSWYDCATHLRAIGQMKRGSSILWRYYNGPYISSAYAVSSGRRVHAQAFSHSLKYQD